MRCKHRLKLSVRTGTQQPFSQPTRNGNFRRLGSVPGTPGMHDLMTTARSQSSLPLSLLCLPPGPSADHRVVDDETLSHRVQAAGKHQAGPRKQAAAERPGRRGQARGRRAEYTDLYLPPGPKPRVLRSTPHACICYVSPRLKIHLASPGVAHSPTPSLRVRGRLALLEKRAHICKVVLRPDDCERGHEEEHRDACPPSNSQPASSVMLGKIRTDSLKHIFNRKVKPLKIC
jgi:hypothetical protein